MIKRWKICLAPGIRPLKIVWGQGIWPKYLLGGQAVYAASNHLSKEADEKAIFFVLSSSSSEILIWE